MTTSTGHSVRMGTTQGRWLLGVTIAGSSMAMLDGTVVNVALARIGQEFDAGFTALQWIANAYTLTLASLILLGGALGDMFGRRRVFLIGTAWFAVASALCGVAPNETVLIAARALQGVGAALLTPGSLAIISASFVLSDRSRAVGAWSGLGGIAAAIGPFLGGWLVDWSWRAVFFINLPVALVILLVSVKHVPETRNEDESHHIDLPGVATMVLALGGLTYALTTAGDRGWTATVLTAALVGVVAAVAFVLIERRAAHPLFPVGMLADRVFGSLNIVTFLVYAGLGVYFFLLVLQLQVVAGWTPLAAGTSLLPVTVIMLLLSARFGALAQRIGARPLMTGGGLLAGAGFAMSLRIGADASYLTDVLPAVLLLGFGLAMMVAPLTSAVLAAAPDDLAGTASGINNAVARSAGLLAVAVIPAVAGLSGAGSTSSPADFDAGFGVAMLIGAGLLVASSVVSWLTLARPGSDPIAAESDPDESDPAAPDADVPFATRHGVAVDRLTHCPLDAPAAHPRDERG